MANNFAYIIMLSAAEDIMSVKSSNDSTAAPESCPVSVNSLALTSFAFQTEISDRKCVTSSLGPVLLVDIIPSLICKLLFPLIINRIPMA
jgi:battenin